MAGSHIPASSSRSSGSRGREGFTLIEMLLVVAVIGVMTSLVITAVTNSAADARLVIARQQQATVQAALNAWIADQSSVGGAQTAYTAATDASAKMTLIKSYLDTNARWYSTGLTYAGGGVQSENMKSIGVTMSFSAWASNDYPRVTLQE